MMNSTRVLRGISAALMAGAAFVAVGAPAMAADIGSYKDEPVEETRSHSITVNGGLTTDYVFRGISQSDEGPAVFAGADIAYGMFYAGFWASSVDTATSDGEIEVDVYAGIKKSFNSVDLDLGVLYYSYPNNDFPVEINYLELKAAASKKIWRDITVTGTVYYSPDYYNEAGATWTFEGKAAAPLPWWGLTLSGTYGHVTSEDDDGGFSAFYEDDNYNYWNVGLSKTFREHYTIDVRYHGTDVDEAFNYLADDRVVATFTFNY